jgi:hypothetical protein
MAKTSGPTSSAQLFINEIPVEFVHKLDNVRVKEKETAIFSCELNKENAPVKWFKGGLEILPSDPKYKFVTDGFKCSLYILDCQLNDKNDYSISLRGRKSSADLEVDPVPAEILKPLDNISIYEKQEIYLECSFSQPNSEPVWLKDNIDIKFSVGSDRFTKKVVENIYTLVIPEAKLEDAGTYACTVKLTKTSCTVKVLEKPVEVMKMLEDQEVVEKQTATFACSLSKPRLKVSWYKNGQKLSESKRIQFVQEGKVYKLVINDAQLDDAAEYKIKFGEEAESNAQLMVKDAPASLKSKLDDKEATEEDLSVFFEVELTKKAKRSDQIKWTLNGKKIDSDVDARYSIESNDKKSKLIIKNVRLEDEGNYALEVNGTKTSAQLTVNELPVRFVKPLVDVSGVEDQTASFECELSKAKWKKTGNEVVVKWFKGQRELRETSKYSIKRDGVTHALTIKQLMIEDVAEYMAVVLIEKTSGKLTIQESNVSFANKIKDVDINEKETATFECEVTKTHSSQNNEPLPVAWFRKVIENF